MRKITFVILLVMSFVTYGQVLNEGFDGGALPTGWSNEYVSAMVDWQFGAANQNATVAPRTGAGMAAFWSNNYNGDQTRLVTPSMDLSVVPSQVLNFYYTQEDWGGDQDELRVYYKTSAAGSWVLLAEFTADTNPVWTEVNLVLPNPSADYYVAFDGTSGYGRGITVDDVIIDNAPSCLTPGSLSVFGTSATTSNLNWVPAGSETDFTYEYGPVGFTPGSGTSGMVTGNTAAISGLTADTDYDFYVQANCGVDGDSGVAGPFTWTQPDEGDSCGTAYVATLEADCSTATPVSLDFTGAPSNISTTCDTFNNYGLWVTTTTDAAGGLTINASAAVDMAIFDACGGTDIECYAGGVSPSVNVSLSPNTQYYLYFWQEGTGSTAMVDVCVSSYSPAPAPNCAEAPTVPADMATDVALPGGLVNLSWTAPTSGPAPTDYEVFFGDTSGSLTSIGLIGSTDTDVDVTGLDFSTTYYWSVVPLNDITPAAGPCAEWSFTTAAPPAGYDCTNPIVVGALPYNTTDDTAGYGDVYSGSPGTDCGSTSSYLNGNDVVYSYTATSDTSLNVTLSGVGNYTGLFVYSDCADIGTTCANGAVNGSSGDDINLDSVAVTNGATYYFVISTWPSPQTTAYTLDIVENTCTNATVNYLAVSNCDVVADTFNVEVDITDMGSATDITVSDDQGSANQTTMTATTLTFGPYANGTDVVITVADDNDANCTQTSPTLTQVACPPVNDNCVDAIELTPGAVFTDNPVIGTNLGATDSGELAPGCASYGGGDAWYSAVIPSDGMLTFEVNTQTGGITDTGGAVYSGSCGAFTLVECNDDGSANGAHPIINVNDMALANQTVYFRVWEFGNNATGEFQVSAYSATLSTNSFENEAAFTYYPNPVKNTLTLNAQNTIEAITMYNMLGQEVLKAAPNAVDSDIDMSGLANGAYFVKVTIANITKTIRVIKQ